MTEQESLQLITNMIYRAKNSYHDSGVGPILWGTVITLCSLLTFVEIHFHLRFVFDIWMLTVFALVPQFVLIWRDKKRKKARRYEDGMMDAVWTVFGMSIFLLVFINANIVNKLNPVFQHYIQSVGSRPAFNYSSFTTSFFLLLYGIPSIITGTCTSLKSMQIGGIICWVCCIVSVYTRIEFDMLLSAIAATSAWLIPGIILYRHNQRRKKGQDV